VDGNDDNWKLSALNTKNYPLSDNGRLIHAQISSFNFYKIRRPSSVSLERINTDPKYIMDLILQNIRTERTLWGEDRYRILSFGDSATVGEYRDSQGRTWITAYWIIGFDDRVEIMYILPLPNGPAVVTTMQPSAMKDIYEWDMKKTCDHVYAAYSGSFTEWPSFLNMEKYIPDLLTDMKFEWMAAEQQFVLECGPVSISADKRVFTWENDSELFLAPSWYKQSSDPELGVRKYIINRDVRGKEYLVLYRNIKPDPKLGASAMENWADLVTGKYPFDEKPAISVKDNTGSVGALVESKSPQADIIHSLYLSMESPENEANLDSRLAALKGGITIRE
jgi:hypothetical protein